MSIALIAFTLATGAQAADQADAASAYADVEAGGLEEIVVTAQKRAQSLQDVPISVSVTNGALLRSAQISTAASLPQLAPSLTFTQGFGPVATSFNIRGVGSYVSELGVQPAVSVVLDGVPLARNAEFLTQFSDVERIEILNGPQGTLFGRNSTGGAINFVRKGPSDTFGATVDGRLSTGEEGGVEFLTNFAITGPIADGIRARVSGYMLQRSDFIDNLAQAGRDHGGENSWGVTAKLGFDLGEDVDLLLTGDLRRYNARVGENHILKPLIQQQQPLVPDVTNRQIALLGGALNDLFTISQDDTTESELKNWAVTADLSWRISDTLRLKSITSYRDMFVATQPDTDSTSASPSNPQGWDILHVPFNNLTKSRPRRHVNWHYLSQELRLEYSDDKFDIVGGGFYQDFKERLDNAVPLLLSARSIGQGAQVGLPTGPSAAYPYYFSDALIFPDDRTKTLAGFLDVTYHPTEAFDIFAGYRLSHEKLSFNYDRTTYFFPVQFGVTYDPGTMTPLIPGARVVFGDSQSQNNWAGRVGARYKLSRDFNIYATASRGYIGAGVDLSRATGGTVANPGASFLEASTARNFELGFKSQLFDRRVRLNGAIYDLLVKDLQAQSIIPGTVSSRVQNAGDIRSRGLELTLEALASDFLSLNGGFSYTKAKFRNFRTGCYVTQTAAQGCVGGTQAIDGKPGLNNPKIKFNIGADFHTPLSENLTFYVRPRYNYQSKVFYTLDHDPEATQKAYGLFDLSVGVSADEGKYDLSLFAKNLTNKHFCLSKQVATVIGRVFCQSVSFDAQRVIGLSGRVNF